MNSRSSRRLHRLGLPLLCALWLSGPVVAALPAPQAQPATAPSSSGPLTLADFLAPESMRLVKLSPSGKSLVAVRRVSGVDQLLKVDLPEFTTTALYQTKRTPKLLADQDLLEQIAFVEWKSDSTLVISVDTPVNLTVFDVSIPIQAPVHMIIDAGGKAAPLLLNETVKGKKESVELSWIQDILKSDAGHVMIGVKQLFGPVEIYRVDIKDGTRELLEKGGDDVVAFDTDKSGNIVTRTLEHDDGSLTLQGRDVGQTTWTKILDFRKRDQRALAKYGVFGLGGISTLYVSVKPETAADGDTEVVRTFDLKTMTMGPVVWSNPSYDVDSIIQDETTGELIAGCYWVDTLQCEFKSPIVAANFKGLDKYFKGERNLDIVSKSDDGSKWILRVSGPDEPGGYFLYDATAHRLEGLGDAWKNLSADRLGHMRRLDFKTRDGVSLSAYVTEPPGAITGLPPLIVMPHGGPEARDNYSFDVWDQFLATRGYVVLQPNFRGSDGFGRKFAQEGYGQWGRRMHDDVMDATKALIAEGRIDPKRVCIVGASYGGFEALYAAAKEPATFRCAASISGISDLAEFVKWQKHFGHTSSRYLYWLKSIGDPDTDNAQLAAASPDMLASTWATPLLLMHGDKDDIVPVDQSRRMKRALESAGKPVRYIEVKGMGHGPATDEESTKVLGELATFLAANLGPAAGSPAPAIAKP